MIGKTLGKFEIVEHLGRGGMADVYKAYQPGLERYVAIKVLHPFLATEENFLTRFKREAKAIAALRHPNIVQVHDFAYDEEGDSYHMVMEFIDGPNLKAFIEDLVERGEQIPLDEAVRIVAAVGDGLEYAHQRGMVHRDVKPANVMFTQDGQIVLTDFGIAKLVDVRGLTASGAMVGTPAYISPEQGKGVAGDARSDLYSLGAVLYQLVTGQLPFDSDTSMGMVLKHISEPLPLPSLLRPDLPRDLEAVIVRALEKDPADRYQTVAAFVDDLRRAVSGQRTPPPAATVSGPALDETAQMDATPPPPMRTPPPDTRLPPPGMPLPLSEKRDASLGASDSFVDAASAPARRRRSRVPLMLGLLLVLLVAAVGTLAYQGRLDDLLSGLGLPLQSSRTPVPVPGETSGAATSTPVLIAIESPSATPTSAATTTPSPTPTRTPPPNLTATAMAACDHGMELVRDVPLASSVLMPGQVFSKTWTISNTGACAWGADFGLVFVFGTQMGIEAGPVYPVAPAAAWDLVLELTAPEALGTYTAAWEIQNGRGDSLGERLMLEIEVVAQVPPTPDSAPVSLLEMVLPELVADSCQQDGDAGEWAATICWSAQGGAGAYRYFAGSVDAESELETACHAFTAEVGAVHTGIYYTTSGNDVPWPLPEDCCLDSTGHYADDAGSEVVWQTVEIAEADCQ